MSVYVIDDYIRRPTGRKAYTMTADTLEEYNKMIALLNVEPSMMSNYRFCILSKTQMKKAKNNGALIDNDARAIIALKKDIMKGE